MEKKLPGAKREREREREAEGGTQRSTDLCTGSRFFLSFFVCFFFHFFIIFLFISFFFGVRLGVDFHWDSPRWIPSSHAIPIRMLPSFWLLFFFCYRVFLLCRMAPFLFSSCSFDFLLEFYFRHWVLSVRPLVSF